MLSSKSHEVIAESENITRPCNNEYWRATKEEPDIIVDLKCLTRVDSFSILNGYGDFAIKQYSLLGSRDLEGPWTQLYTGELPLGLELSEEVSC